ncbi:MAG TPA: hypothetical protein VFD58_08940 [Blastocatellia bacterium]|nr:hypothetical protein [Blastocatellia bacterium]
MNSNSHPILEDILRGVKDDPSIEVEADLLALTLYPASQAIKSDDDLEKWAGENNLSFERITSTRHRKPKTLFRFSRRRDS